MNPDDYRNSAAAFLTVSQTPQIKGTATTNHANPSTTELLPGPADGSLFGMGVPGEGSALRRNNILLT